MTDLWLRVCILIVLFAAMMGLNDQWGNTRAIVQNIIAALLYIVGEGAIAQRSRLKLWLQCVVLRHEKMIRLSVSYLIRIKIDDEYLLVRGNRITTQFQPVGGVYKALPNGLGVLHGLEVLDDDKMRIDADSRSDLRVRVPGAKVMRFLDWFSSAEGREVGVWREFSEELVRTGILSGDDFPFVECQFVRRRVSLLHESVHYKCDEILVADIFDLVPSERQLAAFRRLRSEGHKDVVWLREGVIRRRGVDPPLQLNANVSETAEWTL